MSYIERLKYVQKIELVKREKMTENKDEPEENIDGPLENSLKMKEDRWKLLKEISRNYSIDPESSIEGVSYSTLRDRLEIADGSFNNYIEDFKKDGLVEVGKSSFVGTISNREKRKGKEAKLTKKGKIIVDRIEDIKETLKEEKDLEYTILDKHIEWFNKMTDKLKESDGSESIQICSDISKYMKEENRLIGAIKSDLPKYLENKIMDNTSFKIGQEYWEYIEEGGITEELRNIFRKNDVPLSKKAKISGGETNFRVKDTERTYFLSSNHETLFVFEGDEDIALAWLGELYRQLWKGAFLNGYEEWIEDENRLQNLWSIILDKPVGIRFSNRMELLELLLDYYDEKGKEIEEEYLEKIVTNLIKSLRKYSKVGIRVHDIILSNGEDVFEAWKKIITENINEESYLRDIKNKLIQVYGKPHEGMPYEIENILRNDPYLDFLPEKGE